LELGKQKDWKGERFKHTLTNAKFCGPRPLSFMIRNFKVKKKVFAIGCAEWWLIVLTKISKIKRISEKASVKQICQIFIFKN